MKQRVVAVGGGRHLVQSELSIGQQDGDWALVPTAEGGERSGREEEKAARHPNDPASGVHHGGVVGVNVIRQEVIIPFGAVVPVVIALAGIVWGRRSQC
jgi:hypothetical protein